MTDPRLIYPDAPEDWKALQVRVAQIFNESGAEAEVERVVPTVRGSVQVDVHVVDHSRAPSLIYVCECKHWKANVPQSIVHQLRSVVNDIGAHAGFLISSSDFQSGAKAAAANSNVQLLTWGEFQSTFYDNWLQGMYRKLELVTAPILDYMDVLDDRVSRALDTGSAAQNLYYALFHKFSCYFRASQWARFLREDEVTWQKELIDPRLDATSLRARFTSPREYFDVLLQAAPNATAAFEEFLQQYGA